jgi:hypothetical protein
VKKKQKRITNGPKLPCSIRRLFPNLKSVSDATKPVEVTVKASDCSIAKRMVAFECAMAKAAKRQYHADGAVIGLSYSYIVKGDHATRYRTPESVARKIVSFDRRSDFAPGEYALSPVPPSMRLGTVFEHSDSRKNSARLVHKQTVRVRVAEKGN